MPLMSTYLQVPSASSTAGKAASLPLTVPEGGAVEAAAAEAAAILCFSSSASALSASLVVKMVSSAALGTSVWTLA